VSGADPRRWNQGSGATAPNAEAIFTNLSKKKHLFRQTLV